MTSSNSNDNIEGKVAPAPEMEAPGKEAEVSVAPAAADSQKQGDGKTVAAQHASCWDLPVPDVENYRVFLFQFRSARCITLWMAWALPLCAAFTVFKQWAFTYGWEEGAIWSPWHFTFVQTVCLCWYHDIRL